MSRILPRRKSPQNWTPERRARQSAIARRRWAEKPHGLRGRRSRLADDLDEEKFTAAMADIASEFFFRRFDVLLNMQKPAFVELAEAAGVDPDIVEAVRARLLRDFKEGDDDE